APVIGVPLRAPLVTKTAPPIATSPPPIDAPRAPPVRRVVDISSAQPLLPVVVPRSASSSDPQMAQRRLLGYITGSLGIVGLGFGATTSVIALRKDALDRQCADPIRICSPDGKATSGHTSLSAMSAVGWVVGLAGVSAGAYLIVTSNRRTGIETAIGTDF